MPDATTTDQPAAQSCPSASVGHPDTTACKCPRCKRNVSTKQRGTKRVFVTHGPDPNGSFFCGNSGGPVPK